MSTGIRKPAGCTTTTPESRSTWCPGSLQRLVLRANRRQVLEHWTAHQLRHALGSQLVNEGTQIATVAVLLGYADTRSTERYWTPDHQQAREVAAARRPQ